MCVYYKKEDLIYEEKYLRELWSCARTTAAGNEAFVRIPPEAKVFYFTVEGRMGENPDFFLHAATGVYTRDSWQSA